MAQTQTSTYTKLKSTKRTERSKAIKIADRRARLIERAQAIIADPARKVGDMFQVQELLEAQNWGSLAIAVRALETNDRSTFETVVVNNDSRTLSDAELEQCCKALADALEAENLVGYLFLILDHVAAASRKWNLAAEQVVDIRQHIVARNATAADACTRYLTSSAREDLRSSGKRGKIAKLALA